MNVTCPECGAEWELSGVEQGEIVTCPDCGVDLEVLDGRPDHRRSRPRGGRGLGRIVAIAEVLGNDDDGREGVHDGDGRRALRARSG